MIGTHAPKLFNGGAKADGLRAKLPACIPAELICSATTKMRRELWALPRNAAEMATERAMAAGEGAPGVDRPDIPRLRDGNIKQILLPVGQDDYVAVSPVSSCGVMHEMYQRIIDQKVRGCTWSIQKVPAAMPNHGEMLMMQAGRLWMLRRGVHRIRQAGMGPAPLTAVQITARVINMNISSGGMALGLPAITAIGGMVHAIEREAGCSIAFAVGFSSIQFGQGVIKATEGRRGKHAKAAIPKLVTEEIVGSGHVAILLRTESHAHLAAIAKAAEKIHRLAGGSMFEIVVKTLHNERPAAVTWIADASLQTKLLMQRYKQDALGVALKAYTNEEGIVRSTKAGVVRSTNTINMVGYAYLSDPAHTAMARGGYPFAWAEPLHGEVMQSAFPSWWKRYPANWGVVWRSEWANWRLTSLTD